MAKFIVIALLAGLTVSCRHGADVDAQRLPKSNNDNERKLAVRLASQINTRMTFDEVSKVVSLTEANQLGIREHGGVFFDVPIGTNYYIQLRFERSSDGGVKKDSRLNLPPAVKYRAMREHTFKHLTL